VPQNTDEKIKQIRNRLRQYRATSIVERALDVLHERHANPLAAVQAAPWITLLLVKWAVQDKMVYLDVGPSISLDQLHSIRQLAWEVQGNAFRDGGPPNAFGMLRTLINPQVQFQRKESWGFLRWPALISRLDSNHTSRQQFAETLGLEPECFMDLSFAGYAAVQENVHGIDPGFFEPLKRLWGDGVDSFLGLVVRDLRGLRHELQRPAARRVSGKLEFFEFPYLQRFPFLKLPSGLLSCWHPLVYARGMEDGVHIRLSELGEPYPQSFSKVFEDYVFELLRDAQIDFFDEGAIWKSAGTKTPAVEAVIDCPTCNVYVEAKMSLFWDAVLLTDERHQVFEKTARVRKAIGQAWRLGGLIRSGQVTLGNCAAKQADFLLIVTSRQLNVGGGEMLLKMYSPEAAEEVLPMIARQHLPPENIFILSVEDFERLSGCLRKGQIDLETLLHNAAVANRNPQTSTMYFSDFLKNAAREGWTQPRLIADARDDSTRRMERHLGD
jgi:hypothetical protein